MLLSSKKLFDIVLKNPAVLKAEGGTLIILADNAKVDNLWIEEHFHISDQLGQYIEDLTLLEWKVNYRLPNLAHCPNLRSLGIYMDDVEFTYEHAANWISQLPAGVRIDLRLRS